MIKKLLLAISLAVIMAATAQAASLRVEGAPASVTPSTIFVVEFIVEDIVIADSMNGYMTFDPLMVDGIGVEIGSWFDQATGAFEFKIIDVDTPGVVSFIYSDFGATYTGSGTAAKVTFHCEGPGLAVIDYHFELASAGPNVIDEVGVIEVDQVIPEPMTLALIGGALAALGAVARKRS